MKIEEKIIMLRKKSGWSQEDLAEKMNLSRQAISRWENGTALPDVQNVLELSKLFNVSTDYLLNNDYESGGDIPIVQMVNEEKNVLVIKKKKLHLIAAISFTIATLSSVAGIIESANSKQFWLSCFLTGLFAANTFAQYVLYFKKQK